MVRVLPARILYLAQNVETFSLKTLLLCRYWQTYRNLRCGFQKVQGEMQVKFITQVFVRILQRRIIQNLYELWCGAFIIQKVTINWGAIEISQFILY